MSHWLLIAAPASAGNGVPAGRSESTAERIVSLNVCADQLLLALGLRDRVVAFSPYVGEASVSAVADQAEGLPMTGGATEEVLRLRPDLVIAGAFAGAQAKARLRAMGVPVLEMTMPMTLAEARAQMRDMGVRLGAAAAGEALAQRLDAALAASRHAPTGLRVLPLQRRLLTTGQGTLLDALLRESGFTNALDHAGLGGYATLPLERAARLRADLLLLDARGGSARDQGEAVLLHPLLEAAYPPARRAVLPSALVICAGPSLAEALMILSGIREAFSR